MEINGWGDNLLPVPICLGALTGVESGVGCFSAGRQRERKAGKRVNRRETRQRRRRRRNIKQGSENEEDTPGRILVRLRTGYDSCNRGTRLKHQYSTRPLYLDYEKSKKLLTSAEFDTPRNAGLALNCFNCAGRIR
eukprot:763373-Hanusia_phi.AAC.3